MSCLHVMRAEGHQGDGGTVSRVCVMHSEVFESWISHFRVTSNAGMNPNMPFSLSSLLLRPVDQNEHAGQMRLSRRRGREKGALLPHGLDSPVRIIFSVTNSVFSLSLSLCVSSYFFLCEWGPKLVTSESKSRVSPEATSIGNFAVDILHHRRNR